MATHGWEKVNQRYELIYQIKSKTLWNIQLAVKICLTFMKRNKKRNFFSYLPKSICHEIMTFEILSMVYADFQINTSEGQSHKLCYYYSYLLMYTELLYGISTQGHSWNWNSSFSSMTQNIQNNNHSCHHLSPKYTCRMSNILDVTTDL